MIAIINISDDETGTVELNKYRLQINHKIILEFTHFRQDGLAVCLEKAAMAVREQSLKDDRDMIGALDEFSRKIKKT